MSREQVLTCGEYANEPESVASLLAIVNPAHWLVMQEVHGWMLQPRLDTNGSGRPRIDVLIQPTRALIEHGWRWGIVGIECKKSATKVGRVVSQAMDYTRCVWDTPNGFAVMSRFVFIWPCEPPKNDLESVMVQHRIGVAHPRGRDAERLSLWFNGTIAYADNGDADPCVAIDLRGGSKQGSR
jgi:hypothetical protein